MSSREVLGAPPPAPRLAGLAEPIESAPARPWMLGLGLVAFGAVLFAFRLAAPPSFSTNEWRLSAYALDALDNGRWLVQTDTLGELASKPPLLTWLAALAALPSGRVGPLALYWPSAAATALTACVLLHAGRAGAGWRAGFLAAATYLGSYGAFDQMRSARYDGLLTLPVALAAVFAWRAWRTGRGWTWFWLVAAAGTLVKGPLALVLSGTGLLAALWERRPVGSAATRGAHRLGVALYVLIAGGWLVLAWAQAGAPIVDKLFRRELVAHAVGGIDEIPRWRAAATLGPAWTLIGLYAPWCLAAVAGAVRALRRPAADAEARAFERFALCWLAGGVLMFSVAAHHNARLMYPVVPAAALLAGIELDRWSRRVPAAHLLAAATAVGLGLLALAALHPPLAGLPREQPATVAARDLARELDGPGRFPLTYVDPGGALQVWLGTRRAVVSAERAARLLAGPAPAFVVAEPGMWADRALAGHGRELLRWPAKSHPQGRIVSNHPRLEWTERAALLSGDFRIELERARLLRETRGELVFRVEPGGAVAVVNEADAARTVRVRLVGNGTGDTVAERRLEPDAAWRPTAGP